MCYIPLWMSFMYENENLENTKYNLSFIHLNKLLCTFFRIGRRFFDNQHIFTDVNNICQCLSSLIVLSIVGTLPGSVIKCHKKVSTGWSTQDRRVHEVWVPTQVTNTE